MIELPSASTGPATLIVVGGHSSGVGKTSVVEHILRSRRRREPWAAVKISAHRHATADDSPPLVEETVSPSLLTQTGRYLEAGACRAFLCRTPDARLADTATFLRGLLAEGTSVIVESNRIARLVLPNILLFIVSPSVADWKPSSGPCLTRADALVTGERAATVPGVVAARGARLDGRPVFEMDADRYVRGLDAWLDGRLAEPRGPHALA
ncbi:MAG: hypothetical protein Q7R30_06230 [Acidobacteriota bacterium]|nr:hypothetical protein [Acidobacteriota bacterium]